MHALRSAPASSARHRVSIVASRSSEAVSGTPIPIAPSLTLTLTPLPTPIHSTHHSTHSIRPSLIAYPTYILRRSMSSMHHASSNAAATSATAGTATPLTPLPPIASLSPSVIRILGLNPGPMTLQGTNTYLVGTGRDRLLIDTGGGVDGYISNLRSVLLDHRCRMRTIVLTHWHPDHTGGLAQVVEMCRGMHKQEQEQRRKDVGDSDSSVEVPFEIPSVYKFDGPRYLPQAVVNDAPDICAQIQPLHDGQCLEVEGARVAVVHTPGHTDDSISLQVTQSLGEEGTIFTGDTVLGEGTAVFSDLHSYLSSLRHLLSLAPRRLYPAHGRPLVAEGEAVKHVSEYIRHRQRREEQIVAAMREARREKDAHPNGLTAQQIAERVYAGLDPKLLPAACTNVLHHLSNLRKERRVEATLPSGQLAPTQHEESTCGCEQGQQDESKDKANEPMPEVARAFAIAARQAEWRWKLIEADTKL